LKFEVTYQALPLSPPNPKYQGISNYRSNYLPGAACIVSIFVANALLHPSDINLKQICSLKTFLFI